MPALHCHQTRITFLNHGSLIQAYILDLTLVRRPPLHALYYSKLVYCKVKLKPIFCNFEVMFNFILLLGFLIVCIYLQQTLPKSIECLDSLLTLNLEWCTSLTVRCSRL